MLLESSEAPCIAVCSAACSLFLSCAYLLILLARGQLESLDMHARAQRIEVNLRDSLKNPEAGAQ